MSFSRNAMALIAASASTSAVSPSDFLVSSLPGLAKMPDFKVYSGFMPATNGTELFFVFVESAGDPSTDPVYAIPYLPLLSQSITV